MKFLTIMIIMFSFLFCLPCNSKTENNKNYADKIVKCLDQAYLCIKIDEILIIAKKRVKENESKEYYNEMEEEMTEELKICITDFKLLECPELMEKFKKIEN